MSINVVNFEHVCYNVSNFQVFFLLFFVCLPVKKDVRDETDNKVPQFKKKAKELRILDAKTAQNLCKLIHNFFSSLK